MLLYRQLPSTSMTNARVSGVWADSIFAKFNGATRLFWLRADTKHQQILDSYCTVLRCDPPHLTWESGEIKGRGGGVLVGSKTLHNIFWARAGEKQHPAKNILNGGGDMLRNPRRARAKSKGRLCPILHPHSHNCPRRSTGPAFQWCGLQRNAV